MFPTQDDPESEQDGSGHTAGECKSPWRKTAFDRRLGELLEARGCSTASENCWTPAARLVSLLLLNLSERRSSPAACPGPTQPISGSSLDWKDWKMLRRGIGTTAFAKTDERYIGLELTVRRPSAHPKYEPQRLTPIRGSAGQRWRRPSWGLRFRQNLDMPQHPKMNLVNDLIRPNLPIHRGPKAMPVPGRPLEPGSPPR